MSATDHTDRTAERGDDASPWQPGRRLVAVAGAALLAGLLAGGATGLAGLAGWAAANGSGDPPAHGALKELADLSGQLATSIALYAAAGPSGRDTAGTRIEMDAARIAALLSRLPEEEPDDPAVATMGRLVAGIGAEIADLRRLVARHDEEAQALDAMAGQVRERHRSFERSLALLPEDGMQAKRFGPAALPQRPDMSDRLDDTGDELASHLYAALATSDPAGLAEHRMEVRRLADRLRQDLEAERVDATTVRRMDAARRLAALGVDTDNVFDRRDALAEMTASALAAARGARDRADALGTLARSGAEQQVSALRPLAPALVASALAAGLVTAFALVTALRSTGSPPAAPAASDPRHGGDGAEAALPPLRIVVADDERLNRMVAAALLGRNGHEVTLVEDGAAAVEAVEHDPVDLVLMDLRMPRLDGLGATRAIRALPDQRRAGTRVVVLTASAIADDARDAEAAGADAVLPKPLRWDTLEPLLRRLFVAGALPPQPAGAQASAASTEFDGTAIRQMRELLPAERVSTLIETTESALTAHHAALIAAWASGNRHEVSALAHRIAGVSGVYGCSGLRAAAQALEQAVDRGVGDPSALIREVDGKTGPALAYLRSLRAANPTGTDRT